MNKKLILGMLLIAGSAVEVNAVTGNVRRSNGKYSILNITSSDTGNTNAHNTKPPTLEQRIKKAQTKFENKAVSAAYEFVADYIKAMHSQQSDRFDGTTIAHKIGVTASGVSSKPKGSGMDTSSTAN